MCAGFRVFTFRTANLQIWRETLRLELPLLMSAGILHLPDNALSYRDCVVGQWFVQYWRGALQLHALTSASAPTRDVVDRRICPGIRLDGCGRDTTSVRAHSDAMGRFGYPCCLVPLDVGHNPRRASGPLLESKHFKAVPALSQKTCLKINLAFRC